MKKPARVFLTPYIFVILSIALISSSNIYAQTKVFIPDTNFRSFLITNYPTFMDGSGDSLIIASAATLSGPLNCGNQNIADLTGVEYFVNITQLNCFNNQLTSLPSLANMTSLQQLNCGANQLTVLPALTNNTALKELHCMSNQLIVLPDLTNNTALEWLWCYNNQLTVMPDLSANTALIRLRFFSNLLTTMPDLTNNTALFRLWAHYNKFDFSDAREMRIADTISSLTQFNYSAQNPFGVPDTFDLNTGDALVLNIANQDSALSYQWFRETDTLVGATDTMLTILNVTLADSGLYTCRSYGTALDSNNMTLGPGITSFVSEPFTVNISLSLTNSMSSIIPVSCNGASDGKASVITTGGEPPYTYLWLNSTNDTVSQSDSTANAPAGDYYAIVYDSLGTSDTALIVITEPPAISGSQTLDICAGDSVIVGSSIYDTTGVYTDIFTASNGCDSTYTTSLTVIPIPLLILTVSADTICYGDSTQIFLVVIGGVNPLTRIWNNGLSDSSTHIISPVTTTTYTVTVIDGIGCSDSTSLAVVVQDPAIVGIVTQSTASPLQNTKVYLVVFDPTDSSLATVDTAFTDGSGYYQFLPTDAVVYIKAAPDSAIYPDEMPTYYNASLVFQTATPINVTDCDTIDIGFSTISGTNPGGMGFIGGLISQGAGKKAGVGDPVPNLTLFLINDNTDVVAYTATDANGYFSFPNISYGPYYIWVDLPFIDNSMVSQVTIDVITPVKDSLLFSLHGTWLELIDTSVSINEIRLPERFDIYPNPNTGQFTLNIDLQEETTLSLKLYHFTGQLLLSEEVGRIIGNYSQQVDLSTYAKGIYYVQIMTGEGVVTRKVVYQ